MWVFLVGPVLIIAAISLLGILRRPPSLVGVDPEGLRTVVTWRDPLDADAAADPQELLRQLVNTLAEQRYIFSSTIERAAGSRRGPRARVDVRELRFDLCVRPFGGGGWFLWVEQDGSAPADTDDLRQLLTGLYRALEARHAEAVGWQRRERLSAPGAPSPFFVE
jgi:hypothetical protein